MEELYRTLGYAKCEELFRKELNLWRILQLSKSRMNAPVRGAVFEGLARDFIREYLPVGFALKSGLASTFKYRKDFLPADAKYI